MEQKQTKVLTRRRKFIPVELPLFKSRLELLGNSNEELLNKTIKLDLTRYLKGKSVEGTFIVLIKDKILTTSLFRLKLMPYFIRRMIRKKVSYVEDSFLSKSQESLLVVKPFIITRKKVSRVVRKTLRNKARNWLEGYIQELTDEEIFSDILTNKLQKSLSLFLKKTYPLSLCEIRILEVKRPLLKEEIPEKKTLKDKVDEEKKEIGLVEELKKIEEDKIKEAVEEIKKVQKKASMKENEIEMKDEDKNDEVSSKLVDTKIKKTKKDTRRKKITKENEK